MFWPQVHIIGITVSAESSLLRTALVLGVRPALGIVVYLPAHHEQRFQLA
jgi:hypothetical protein